MFKLLFGTGTKSKLTRNEIEAKAAAGEELKSGDLRGVNLNKAKLSGARFETWFQYGRGFGGSKIEGADLSGATLASAIMPSVNLRGANLSGASLESAALTWANLSGADLRSAELYGADLRGARLEHANLHGAYYGAKTQWPTGFDPAAAGAVFEEVEELITRQTAAMTEEEKERFEETLEELKAMSDNRDIDAKQEHDYSKLEMSEKQETSGRLTVNLDGHAEVYHHRGGEPFSPAEMRKMRAKTDSVLAKIGAGESLEGVDFSEAFLLRDVDLTGANLTDTNLSGVDLSGANLERANLSNAALSKKANLRDADLRGANLRGAQLDTADLRGANLDNADLHGANLFEANLSHADLRGANLTGALLLFANLRGANLSGLDLKGADLLCADLRNANLSESNLSGVDVSGAHYNADTKWPEGFDPVAAGAGLVD